MTPESESVGVICTIDYYHDWVNLDKEAYKNKKEVVQEILIELQQIHGIKELIEYTKKERQDNSSIYPKS